MTNIILVICKKFFSFLRMLWSKIKKVFGFYNDYTSADDADISIHPLSHDPTAAWKEMSKTQRFIKVTVQAPKSEVPANKVRIVCMSDTHSLTPYIKFEIPDGDIFIHAGDFTGCGELEDVMKFNDWIGTLPHKNKIVIAGNHELSFDRTFKHPLAMQGRPPLESPKYSILASQSTTMAEEDAAKAQKMRAVLSNCTYIEDELVEICGLRIYGSPWQPEYGKWAFNVTRGRACLEKWNCIPENIDILITHGPPLGHGDMCRSGVRAGCVELLSTVQRRVKPKYHVFGHIHEGYGVTSDGRIIYVNASTCDTKYKPINKPIVFDITLPAGVKKYE